ncbi:hypothetical protein T11_4887 [Trichinella zimbabwensis]|uniref:Peptidase aspartic putative domain-containing protein n=1 Tax=Trichinella zimbabwensis TaxID=268475 RepID=A0A0V1I0Q2_9BILA|nr:hypothetical protein T11_4887 [Trichinella zimbabwensis]
MPQHRAVEVLDASVAQPHLYNLALPEEDGDEELSVQVVIGVDYFFRMLGSTIIRGGEIETRLGCVICGPQPLPLTPSAGSLDAAKQTVATLAKTGGPSHVTTILSNAKRILSPPVETLITTRNYMLQNEEAFEALSLASPDDTLAGRYLNYRLNSETLFAESDHWYNVGELYRLLFTMRRTNLNTQMGRDAMFDALSSTMEVNTPFGEFLRFPSDRIFVREGDPNWLNLFSTLRSGLQHRDRWVETGRVDASNTATSQSRADSMRQLMKTIEAMIAMLQKKQGILIVRSPHGQVCRPDLAEVLGAGSDWDQLGTRGISGRQGKAGSTLLNNYKLVVKQLDSVQRRLMQDWRRLKEYSVVIRSYLDNDWAEEAPGAGSAGRTWYLPHHAVYKKGSTGDMKFRIVFDGSAQCGGISLNDRLEPGANLQADLLGILICFRRYRIGLQADIQKMYLHKWLCMRKTEMSAGFYDDSPECRKASGGIHWGTQRDLVQHVRGRPSCELWLVPTGIAEAKRLAGEATRLLGKGGFHLAKWASNSPDVREADVLTFCPPQKMVTEIPDMKRGVLRLAASVYDRLGCLAPYTARANMIIQLRWQAGIIWYDPVPSELSAQWQTWKEELPGLCRMAVDRDHVQVSVEDILKMKLHGFADASGKAYSAVLYLQLTHRDERVEARLVAAKSRVALIKCLSLLRLVLKAALLCARLLAYVRRSPEGWGSFASCEPADRDETSHAAPAWRRSREGDHPACAPSTPVDPLEEGILGDAICAREVEATPGAAQGQRRLVAGQNLLRSHQGAVHNAVADIVGADRNLVMGKGPSGESDENWSYTTPVP